MKRFLPVFLLSVSVAILGFLNISFSPIVKAQNTSCDINNVQNTCNGTNGLGSACNDLLSQCTSNISQALEQLKKALAPNEARLNALKTQIASVEDTISSIQLNLAEKKKNINQGYENLAKQQEILNATIKDYYIKSYYNSPLALFLSSNSASEFTKILGYQKANADRDKLIITNIALTIQDLETKQKQLENQEAQLTAFKENLNQQSTELNKLVSNAQAYQATLSNQLSQLSSIQQQILAQKYGSLGISLNSYNMFGGCKSDLLPDAPDPGFSPKIGFFTYGVPNRVGLNQFGAWGRAKTGQDANTILHAYYNFDAISNTNTNIQISVTGYGTYSLEDYMKRIYEVPDSWTDNDNAALKAQAIAARSYALSYTNNGQNPICATDQCQVFKADPKGGNWDSAVNATAGQVMLQNGNPIKAWFSSTHGGYVFTSSDIGWSSTSFTKRAQDASGSINSFSDLQNNAYDKGSPWFYCDWGSRASANKTAWLRPEEAADIVNVVMLVQADSGTKEHLYQTDKSNPAGTDTWDQDRVKQELRSRNITPFDSISDLSVDADFGTGRVTTVHAGGQSFSGDFFKTYFNLRAPGNVQIVGPLFNVERK